ncbi:MAG: PKD domain-containing protein [bacterium]|nr:PKD domain-containing protein [bacterium]
MPPVVSITSPVNGANVSQLMAAFTTAASDPDGGIVLYEWDFEDDGVFDYSGPANEIANPYAVPGDYRVKVRVTDDRGAIGLAVVRFTAVEDIYVSAATGSRSTTVRATRRWPPSPGFNRAGGRRFALVADGPYNENVALRDSVSVIGGCRRVDWTRGPAFV